MSTELQLSRAQEINFLHNKATGYAELAVKQWIEIGRLLSVQKEETKHGEWESWVDENLAFNERQAWKYMRVYQRRETLNLHPSGDLESLNRAVALLAEPKEAETAPPPPQRTENTDWLKFPSDKKADSQAESPIQTDPADKQRIEKQQQQISDLNLDRANLKKRIRESEEELVRLREQHADRAEVVRIQKQILELKEKHSQIFKDAQCRELIQGVLVRGRTFFTKECKQIPALHLTEGSKKVMREDILSLTDLVENWVNAIKERLLDG